MFESDEVIIFSVLLNQRNNLSFVSLRSVTSFLLSHIGLLSLVVGYCIMGAFIFQELERANEIETKREMKTKRLAMTDTLWDITK